MQNYHRSQSSPSRNLGVDRVFRKKKTLLLNPEAPMTSPREFFAILFVIVGVANSFVINNGDTSVDGAVGVAEILLNDEAEVAASSSGPLGDSLLDAELKRIIENEKMPGNEESLEPTTGEARPELSRPSVSGRMKREDRSRATQCYFNPVSCFKK